MQTRSTLVLIGMVSLVTLGGACSLSDSDAPYGILYLADSEGLTEASDANMIDSRGIFVRQDGTLIVANAGTGTLSIFGPSGRREQIVQIPSSNENEKGRPTSVVYDESGTFHISQGVSADVLIATLDGTICAWSSASDTNPATVVLDESHSGASYTGAILAKGASENLLYVVDFAHKSIKVFDSAFELVELRGDFSDPSLPADFVPFNLIMIDDRILVLFARTGVDGQPLRGAGEGFISTFDLSGHFLKRLVSRGELNAPWGIALAPQGFGTLGGALLVGNHGDGKINAFDIKTGTRIGYLEVGVEAIVIEGLWGITIRLGDTPSESLLYFSSGDGDGGLIGVIGEAVRL